MDTVYVPEVHFVQVQVVDSVRIKAYELELLGLKEEISSLRNLNSALGFLEDALRLYYQKYYEEAIKRCDEAISQVPTLALAYIRKGSIYFAQGNYQRSREEYRKALQHDPGNEEVLAQLRRIEQVMRER